MHAIQEIRRLASPAPKPQSIAWDGHTLWMGSRETRRIYALNPSTWTVSWECPAPGIPWGMTVADGELRVLCGEGDDDHRFIRRLVPGQGFDEIFHLPCPDDSGSHLSHDACRLYVSQWYPKKIIRLDPAGAPEQVYSANHGICGHTLVDGVFYLVTTDHEETTEYWLTRLDPRAAVPEAVDIATIPFAARGLAFDGTRFWTNHREQDQIVAFARVDA
jgi:hypothetical protein